VLPIVLLAIAAVIGAALSAMHFRRRGLSMPLALGHGLFAAGGLVAVLVAGLSGSLAGSWKVAFGLLLVAAVGGFALFAMHLRKSELSSPLVAMHAIAAVAGFIVLLVAALG